MTVKKVTFNIPEDEDAKWKNILFKFLLALMCVMLLASLSRYCMQRYDVFRIEQIQETRRIEKQQQFSKDFKIESATRSVEIKGAAKDEKKGAQKVGVNFRLGKTDEWFSVGSNEWRLDSADNHKNYSILTDVDQNYTGLSND